MTKDEIVLAHKSHLFPAVFHYFKDPLVLSHAKDQFVFDADGNEYLDCTMALGSVALGYAETNVTRSVVEAIARGNVSGLSSAREVEVAERLCGVIPCADKVQFLKTGAEAMAAAVRLARSHPGRRSGE